MRKIFIDPQIIFCTCSLVNYINVEGEGSINESNLPHLTIVQKHHLSAYRPTPSREDSTAPPTERRTGVKRASTVNNGTRVARKMRVTARFVWNHMWLCKPLYIVYISILPSMNLRGLKGSFHIGTRVHTARPDTWGIFSLPYCISSLKNFTTRF